MLGLGVDLGQGYLFGHPEQVEVWAATRTRAGRKQRCAIGTVERPPNGPNSDGIDAGPRIRLRTAILSVGDLDARRRR